PPAPTAVRRTGRRPVVRMALAPRRRFADKSLAGAGFSAMVPSSAAPGTPMDKPARSPPRALADIARKTLNAAFAKQGFASTELVTRWADIVGADIAAHCEPERIRWPRPVGGDLPEPGTIVL